MAGYDFSTCDWKDDPEMVAAHTAAYDEHARHQPVRAKYHAGEIGDDEFLDSQKRMNDAYAAIEPIEAAWIARQS